MRDRAEVDDPLLVEGSRVGDFLIRGFLGQGAMGQVYAPQDITLNRRVALKFIKRAVMQGDGVARFLDEARATASFNHPHIVTLHAVGEHDGRPSLALEYLDGESLRARLAAGPLPLREALRYCRAVAEAIAEAHRRDLVHADLKPENIVIPRDGRVRVVDFGVAKLVGGAAYAASGTPAYMAPERWHGVPPTGAIDVWAFGVTLHELITGHCPIGNATLLHLAFATDTLELPHLPAESWACLVRDCLALHPTARPPAEELIRRIDELLDPGAASAEADVRERETGAAGPRDQPPTPQPAPTSYFSKLWKRSRRCSHVTRSGRAPSAASCATRAASHRGPSAFGQLMTSAQPGNARPTRVEQLDRLGAAVPEPSGRENSRENRALEALRQAVSVSVALLSDSSTPIDFR